MARHHEMTPSPSRTKERPFPSVRDLIAFLLLPALCFPPGLRANPTGGEVVAGQATISTSGSTLTVNQASDRAIIHWQDFSIASGHTTTFVQPSATSAALNRVTGGNPSAIHGTLQSNGQIYLINPNGVLVGAGGVVDTGGFLASTLDVSDSDFIAGGDLRFSGGSTASVVNLGKISGSTADVILIAHTVENHGTLDAPNGTAALAAGSEVLVKASGEERVFVEAGSSSGTSSATQAGLIRAAAAEIKAAGGNEYALAIKHSGVTRATGVRKQGGRVYLSAGGKGGISNSGMISARKGKGGGGRVKVQTGGSVANDGVIDASGTRGGKVEIAAERASNTGTISAAGSQGAGGEVGVATREGYHDTRSSLVDASGATRGGSIRIASDGPGARIYTSSTLDARGHAGVGGSVVLTADELFVMGSQILADGATQGGSILVGGGYQGGDPGIPNADSLHVNASARLSANATQAGDGGLVVLWADGTTVFSGRIEAKGGVLGGDGGFMEVSGKEAVAFGGFATAEAPLGTAGTLLLDPKNIVIDASGVDTGSGPASFEFVDPNKASDNNFGTSTLALSTGNVVITAYGDDLGGSNAGAVYLFDGGDGTLVSALRGSTAGDLVGYGGVFAVGDGNFVIRSQDWNNDRGAVTWGSGTAGVSGTVSAANSLVGSAVNDLVGSSITVLSNGNYVVRSVNWSGSRGAATWGNGNTGVSGAVSASNSLVGSTANDQVGNSVVEVGNGNYVVRSFFWGNGGIANAGAVTWGSGTAGVVGTISASNSLVGTTANDQVGSSGITVLSNGNYVVRSVNWSGGRGAVTWGSGNTGVSGAVSASNSLVGSTANDQVGIGGVTALSNGNYVVRSEYWSGNRGAVTWGDGTNGTSGVVGASNSLVGTTVDDRVGSGGITALSNGNYVVRSHLWDNGAATDAGAVTWGSGSAGVSGVVSASNSLVGTTANDRVGSTGTTALSNGNYVVRSHNWNGSRGAVTWGDGTNGTSGVVSASNSLVGSTANDLVGSGSITVLSNGNYVVNSPFWDNGGIVNAGAVTWGSGTAGVSGAVSASNSLVGSTANDSVGDGGITALSNGNYVVNSPFWDNGGIVNAGAVTWGSGSAGVSGTVSASNSLVGTTTNDNVGNGGITVLSNGNYVVSSYNWNGNRGAVTWGSGTVGTSGAVSASNSLVGGAANNYVGNTGITVLGNGNYVVRSQNWNGNRGAVTWGDGTTGTSGTVSDLNSLVGTTAGDQVGVGGVTALSNGNYVVSSQSWVNGSLVSAGAATWGSGTGGTVGEVTDLNSLVGGSASANLQAIVEDTVNGTYLVRFTSDTSGGAGGRVYAASISGGGPVGLMFGDDPSATVTITAARITDITDTGTGIILQANNDITVNQAIATSAGGSGGSITMQAGRSILLNADITTDNGNLTLVANETLANGVIDAHRDTGDAVISMASGVKIDAGTGAVTITLADGAGKTNLGHGSIVLRDIDAGTLTVSNLGNGTAADIELRGALAIAGATNLVANRSIIGHSGASLATQGGDIVVNANRDATGGGNIQLTGTTVASNGGSIVLGGGANPLTTAAIGIGTGNDAEKAGIYLSGGSINAGADTVQMRGQGIAGTGNSYGIRVLGGAVIGHAAATGAITLHGTGGAVTAGSGLSYNDGIFMTGSSAVRAAEGAIVLTGIGNGGGAGGSDHYGVHLNGATVQSHGTGANAATVTLNGTGGTGTNFDNAVGTRGYGRGVYIGASTSILSVLGDIQITGTGADAGGQNIGIYSAGTIESTGSGANAAKVTLTGAGGNGAGNNYGVHLTGTTRSAVGDVTITGTGGNGGTSNHGVIVNSSGRVISTGAGADAAKLFLNGTGGAGVGTNQGIYMTSNGRVTSTAGAISLTGVGQGSGTGSHGINLFSSGGTGAVVESLGSATVSLHGTGSSGGTGTNQGVALSDAGTTGATHTAVTGVDGAISITGFGGSNGPNNYGVQIADGAVVRSTGTGANAATITVAGTGGDGTSTNHGVFLTGADTRLSSVDGAVSITGTGRGSTTSNHGIHMTAGAKVTSTGTGSNAATISLDGTGGATGTGTTQGVNMEGASAIESVAGNIRVDGQGGLGTGATNRGIYLSGAAKIISSGTAGIALDGRGGGAGGTGNGHLGIGMIGIGTEVRSVNGNIGMTGVAGGSGAGTNHDGVQIGTGSLVISTGSADIGIDGTGGLGTGSSHGVYLTGLNAEVRSTGSGAISIKGAAHASSTASSDNGIYLYNGSLVTSTGTGTIKLDGTAGQNGAAGVRLYGSDAANSSRSVTVQSHSGAITIEGKGGTGGARGISFAAADGSGSAGRVLSTGNAAIILEGVGGAGASNPAAIEFATTNAPHRVGGPDADGDITLIADSITAQGTTQIQSSGHLLIQPRTSTRGIGIGDGATSSGTLYLGNAVLDSLQDGFASITIGHAGGSGAVDVRSHTFKDNLVIRTPTGTGDIFLNGALATGSGSQTGTITLQAGRNVIGNTGSSVTTQAQAIVLNSNRDATGGGNIQLFGTTIASNGGAITLGGGLNPLTTAAIGISSATEGSKTGVFLSASTINSGAGTISLRGLGLASARGFGVDVAYNSSIVSTTGAIDVHGVGGGGAGGSATNSNVGIFLRSTGSTIASQNGNIHLVGEGGTGATSGSTNFGILVDSNATVTSTGTGTITLEGTGGGNDSTTNYGTGLRDGGKVIGTAASSGAISVTGQGGYGSHGIYMVSGGQILSQGTSTITLDGIGGTTGTAGSSGVYLTGTNTKVESASGNIRVEGQGGTVNAANNHGITMAGAVAIASTGAGTVTLIGDGGAGTSDNYGIHLTGSGTRVQSALGAILLEGTGGDGSGSFNHGIFLNAGAKVVSTSTATVTLDGEGGKNGFIKNHGVFLTGTGTAVESLAGDIRIDGQGGTGTGDSNQATPVGSRSNHHGVSLEAGAQVTSTGTSAGSAAKITIEGTGGHTTVTLGTALAVTGPPAMAAQGYAQNHGINMTDATTKIASAYGDIALTGQGGTHSGGHASSLRGVYIAGATVESTGTGAGAANLSIVGTGTNGTGQDQGVFFSSSAKALSVDGNITMQGDGNVGLLVGGTAATQIKSTGDGNLHLIGTGPGTANGIGHYGPAAIESNTGDIMIETDRLLNGGGAVPTIESKGNGRLFIQPRTATTSIGIGNGAVGTTLNWTTAQLDGIQDGFASITIGHASGSGAVDVRSYTFKDNLTIRTPMGNGDITLNGVLATGSGTQIGTITLQAGRNIIGNAGASITTQGQVIVLNSDRDATNGGNIQLTGTTINSNGGDITLGGGANPLTTAGIGHGTGSAAQKAGIHLDGSTLTAGAGAISLRGRGIAGTDNAYGIHALGGSVVGSNTSTGTITLHGTGGTGTTNGWGVNLLGSGTAVRSQSGDISITGQGGNGSGNFQYGVMLWQGAKVVSTGSAGVTLNGTGGNGASYNRGVYMDGAGTEATSAGGAVSITGTGNGSGTENYGIYLDTQAKVLGSGSASVTLDGTGGSGSNTNHGIYLLGSGTGVAVENGALSITGRGAGSGAGNYGVFVNNQSSVAASGTGSIAIDGTGGGAGSGNRGLVIGAGIVQVADGALTLNGTGSATGTGGGNDGIWITTGGLVDSSGGKITLDGTARGAGNQNVGVVMGGGGKITATNAAEIDITGRGSVTGGDNNFGFFITDANTAVTGQSGVLSITGIGGGGGTLNQGIRFAGTASPIATTTGDITLTGHAAAGTAEGILLYAGARTGGAGTTGDILLVSQNSVHLGDGSTAGHLQTGAGGGSITVRADQNIVLRQGSTLTTQGQAIVLNSDRDAANGGNIRLIDSTITSNGGAVTLGGGADPTVGHARGFGSGSEFETGDRQYGVFLHNTSLSSGAGNILIRGEGHANGNNNIGVRFEEGSNVNSTSGEISIAGLGGSDGSASDGSLGFYLQRSSIASTTGAITITGTARAASGMYNFGLGMEGTGANTARVESASGAITLVGIGSGDAATGYGVLLTGTARVLSSGTSDIILTATSPDAGTDFRVEGAGSAIFGGPSATGDITVNANTIDWGAGLLTLQSTGGNLLIQPRTATTSIGIGDGAAGTLNLDNAELNGIQNGFSSITIGHASGSGVVDVRSHTFKDPLIIRTPTGNGDITLNGALATGSGTEAGSITLEAGRSIFGTTGGGRSITTQGQGITLNADRDETDGGNIQLTGTTVTSNGGAIVLGGGADPLTTAAIGSGTGSPAQKAGIYLSGGTLNAGAGNITLRGQGIAGTSNAYGIHVLGGSVIGHAAATGNLALHGTGGVGTTGNHGVLLTDTNTAVRSQLGAILIAGNENGIDGGNHGVSIVGGARVESTGTAAGTATITLKGTGGKEASNHGVNIDGSTTVIRSGYGDIKIEGFGGASATANNGKRGVYISNAASIVSDGTGTDAAKITIEGTGGAGGGQEQGVYLNTARINSVDGDIWLKGNGRTTASSHGLMIYNGSQVTAAGSADIRLTGDGSGSVGSISFFNGGSGTSAFTSHTGDIIIESDTWHGNTTGSLSSTGGVQAGDLIIKPLTASANIGIGGGSGTLSISAAHLDMIQDGFSEIYIGHEDGTGIVSVGTYTNFKDNLTIRTPIGNGSINVNGALATGSGAHAGSITLEAGLNILANSGSSIRTDGGKITLNSDRDRGLAGDTVGGRIALASAIIESKGGDIVLGGGDDPLNQAADNSGVAGGSRGIHLTGSARIDSGAGDISMRGKGADTTSHRGIEMHDTSAVVSTSGHIFMHGQGGNPASGTQQMGIAIRGSVTSATGDIDITGVGGSNSAGMLFWNAAKVETGAGRTITLTGIGQGAAPDFYVWNDITGQKATFGNAGGADANVVVNANTLSFDSASTEFKSGGTLAFQPRTAGQAVNIAGTTAGLALTTDRLAAIADGFSEVIIGSAIAGNITVGGAATFTDNLRLIGNSTLAINGALNTGTNRLVLMIGGNTTQSAAITAGSLRLGGNGNFTLEHASNSIGTLAKNGAGSVSLRNAGALTVGSVDTINGVTGSTVDLRALVGNLTLAQGVTGTGSGNYAVALSTTANFINNAGANAVQTPSSRWLVYSNAPAGNTFGGLNSGQGALYNRTATSHAPDGISEGGNRYLFSTTPSLTVQATLSDTKTYGNTYTFPTPVLGTHYSVTGFVDASAHGNVFTQDDAATILSGAPTLDSLGAPASANASVTPYTVTIAQGTLANTAGYGFTFTSGGGITVTQRAITLLATAASKTYGDADPALAVTVSGGSLGGSDTLADVTGIVGRQSGENVGLYDIQLGSGAKAANYSITFNADNDAFSITPKALMIAANDQSKPYGILFTFLGTEFTASGLINGDTVDGVDISSAGEAATTAIGLYPIAIGNATGTGLGNYDITYAGGQFTVRPATGEPFLRSDHSDPFGFRHDEEDEEEEEGKGKVEYEIPGGRPGAISTLNSGEVE